MANVISVDDLPILTRREVEARILKPFLEAFEKELGEEKVRAIVTKIIEGEAMAHGAAQAKLHGSNELKDVPAISGHHAEGGSLDLDVYWVDEHRLMMKTLRCEYCDMYRRIGMAKWAPYLSCLRDDAFIRGINPNFHMERTEVLMTGGSCCDTLVVEVKGDK